VNERKRLVDTSSLSRSRIAFYRPRESFSSGYASTRFLWGIQPELARIDGIRPFGARFG
jgi:hypothetical protein